MFFTQKAFRRWMTYRMNCVSDVMFVRRIRWRWNRSITNVPWAREMHCKTKFNALSRISWAKNYPFLLTHTHLCFLRFHRAAQDQNTAQELTDPATDDTDFLFQAILSPEQTGGNSQSNEFFQSKAQKSIFNRSLSSDRTSAREVFQRIKIAGNVHDMTHMEDLQDAVSPLIRALIIREK